MGYNVHTFTKFDSTIIVKNCKLSIKFTKSIKVINSLREDFSRKVLPLPKD